jgi:hypothetical protein
MRETKTAFEERESVMGWTNIIHTYCSIYFLGLCLRGAVAYHCPVAHALSYQVNYLAFRRKKSQAAEACRPGEVSTNPLFQADE